MNPALQYGSPFVYKIKSIKAGQEGRMTRSRAQNQRHLGSTPLQRFPAQKPVSCNARESRFSCWADPTIRKSTKKARRGYAPLPPPLSTPLCDKWRGACLRSKSTNIDYILHIVYIVQRRTEIGIDGHALFIICP